INAFRTPTMEQGIARMGLGIFFEKSFAPHIDLARITTDDRQSYLNDWAQPGALTAMLNWYRASQIHVPQPDEEAPMPDWVKRGVARLRIPLRIIWGLDDKALLPLQLEGIGEVGDNVDVFPLSGIGHFAPWEAPEQVAAPLKPFLSAITQK
ncbi:MAG: alpha/beta hydrolase, partial [Sphingomicrobium sp.]